MNHNAHPTDNESDKDLKKQLEGLEPPARDSSFGGFNREKLILLGTLVLIVILVSSIIWNGSENKKQTAEEVPRDPLPARKVQVEKTTEPPQGGNNPLSTIARSVGPDAPPALTLEEERLLQYRKGQLDPNMVPNYQEAQSHKGTSIPTRGYEAIQPPVAQNPIAPPPPRYHSADFFAPSPGMLSRLPNQVGASSESSNSFDKPNISELAETVRPRTLWHNTNRLLEGTRIAAMLETPIDTTLPGAIRAIITEDVYAASGNRVLLKKGDVVIGKTSQSTILLGQKCVPSSWHRILRRTNANDGIIEIKFIARTSDALGRSGTEGNVDTHFWERVGYGLLYALISAGASNVGSVAQRDGAASRYREEVSDSFAKEAEKTLDATRVSDPTITVPRATPITIIANTDILFEEGQVEGKR